MSEVKQIDALVIGAGAGGMAAAARLRHYGYRTLLVERRDRVGGRASSMDVGEFTINSGAIFFEVGGANTRLFDELGVDPGVVVPRKPLVLRLGRRDIPMMNGPTGALVKYSSVAMGRLGRVLRLRPAPGLTAQEWLDKLGAGQPVRRIVRNFTAGLFAAEPSDVPADLLFDYLTKPGGLGVYAAHPDGSIGPWRALADHFVRTGGELWLDSSVDSLSFDERGLVDGAVITRAGATVHIKARVVVSNAGPVATVNMCGDNALPDGYGDEIRSWSRPGTLIIANFASRTPIRGLNWMVFFGSTDRLASAANVSALSPNLAPPGWNLYMAASTPHPASGDFDHDTEVATLKREILENYPDYASAQEISVNVYSGDEWPAQRAIAGHDLPNTTPIPNLWNVGDGVREWGGAAQSGCVESAVHVTNQVRKAYPLAKIRS
jgi:phytoene dehydrogenase-like protein